MTPEEQKQHRAIGGRLAVVLRQSQGQQKTPAALQAIAADLLGERTELLVPLKELVSRPGFRQLITKAGSGSGAVERRALLVDLEKTFSPAVITALEELLAGFLDLPSAAVSAAPEQRPEPTSGARVQEKESFPQQRAGKKVNPVALAVSVCAVTATLVVAGSVAMRTPGICAALRLCESGGQVTAVQQTLDAAKRAVADLERATNPASYRSAATDLERALQRLNTETLTPEERQQEQELVAISRKAQAAVMQDEWDEVQLQRAAAAVAAARSLKGVEQQVQLSAADQALQTIGAGGFAAGEATRLRGEVAGLKAEQPVASDQPVAEAQPQVRSWTPPPRSGSAAPTPRTAPPPRAPEASAGSEWREQPLF